MEEPRKRSRRQVWQLAYIAVTLVVIVALGVFDPDVGALFHGGLTVDGFWLALCACGILCFWLLQGCVYAAAGRIVGERISFGQNLRVMMFGEYYSAITPFASGGQPMQLGYYKRYGVSTPKATSILAVRYVGYVSSICLCFLTATIAQGASILHDHPVVFWLTLLGFAVNLLSIVMVVMLMYRASMVRAAGAWVIRLLTRIRPLRGKREKWEQAFENGLVEFTAAAECIRGNPLGCLAVLLLSVCSVAGQFSIAYFVYRAVGLSSAGYFELFSMQIYLYLAASFAPTPGATGATEGGFYLFFSMVFPKSLLYSAMLLWRMFTYYASLLVGALLVVGDEAAAMRRRAPSH